jgi:hypothetical protein
LLDPLPFENENTIELSTEIEEIEETKLPSEEVQKLAENKTDDDEPIQMTLF